MSTRERLLAVGAATFTPAILFVAAANNAILPNLEEIPYARGTALLFAAAFALSFAASLPAFLLAPRRRAARGVARGIVFVGLAALLFDAGAATTEGRAAALPVLVALDAALLALGALLAFVPRLEILMRVFAIVGPLTLLHGGWVHLRSVPDEPPGASRPQPISPPAAAPAPAPRAAGNVYHVLLDGFQREMFEKVVDETPGAWPEGFVLYPRFRTGYFQTGYAMAQLLGGREYVAGESFRDWIDSPLRDGLWDRLARAGVGVTLYPHFDRLCGTDEPWTCRSAQVGLRRAFRTAARRATVDLWFLGLLPRSARVALTGDDAAPGAGVVEDAAWIRRFSLTERLLPPAGDEEVPLLVPPALSVRSFERVLADEAQRPARGQYVFVHAFLPHAPHVLDAECGFRGADADPPRGAPPEVVVRAAAAQARCALGLVSRLVRTLDRVGRLDTATILVHSDHGMSPERAYAFLEAEPDRFAVEWDADEPGGPRSWRHPKTIALRSRALLLVREPGAADRPRVSRRPARMSDLAPTILRALGVPAGGWPGTALSRLDEDEARPVVFHAGAARAVRRAAVAGDSARDWRPRGGSFTRFVLEGGRWRRRGEVPVR